MNKLILALGFGTVLATGMANAADQGHGKITFTGSIIDAPCSISPDSSDQTVDLGQVTDKVLANGGKATPKPFTIDLEDCDVSTLKTVAVTFTGAADAANPDNLGIAGSASGAGIVLVNGAGSVVKLGQASDAQTIQDGSNTLQFSAYLQGDNTSAGVVPGSFQSTADFTLAYQ